MKSSVVSARAVRWIILAVLGTIGALAFAAGPATPFPFPLASPSPSPSASPSPSPSAVPAPKKSLPLTVAPAVADKPVPVGNDLVFTDMVCSVWRSNQIGMKGSLVRSPPVGSRTFWSDSTVSANAASLAKLRDWVAKDETGWFLVTLRAKTRGQAVLYQRLIDLSENGTVVRFTAQSFYPGGALQAEAVWKDGLPESATQFDELGRVAKEILYTAGEVSESHENLWRGRFLASTVIKTPDGTTRETVNFAYTLDGRIRQTERTQPDGRLERFIFRYSDEGLDGAWSESTQAAQSWLYDGAGRLLVQEDWQDGEVIHRVSITWADAQGSRMASRETEDFLMDHLKAEAFDADGRVVQIDESLKGEMVSRISQEWDSEGNLVLKNTVGPQGTESWSAEYTDKQPVSERYAKNGVTVRVVTRQGEDSVDEVYLGGVLRLRAYFHGAEKYKEEDIRDGQVYRTRSFDSR